MYDCGVKLSPKGLFGRQDYEKHACRGTYTLHSLYLLLWANFGCFCMSLLTQPGSDKRIHGHIISEKQPSLRQYCVTQLREVWRLMQNNLGLSKEQTSFFIMRAMDKLRNVSTIVMKGMHCPRWSHFWPYLVGVIFLIFQSGFPGSICCSTLFSMLF